MENWYSEKNKRLEMMNNIFCQYGSDFDAIKTDRKRRFCSFVVRHFHHNVIYIATIVIDMPALISADVVFIIL